MSATATQSTTCWQPDRVGGRRQQRRSRPRGTGRTPCTCRAAARAARCRGGRRAIGTARSPTSRAAMIDDRQPREHRRGSPSTDEAAEHEHLVGERVEERARRVVPSRRASQPSRLSVRHEHEPQRRTSATTSPRPSRISDQHRDRDQQPRDRDDVGRRRDASGPNALGATGARASVTRVGPPRHVGGSRSGPTTPVTRRARRSHPARDRRRLDARRRRRSRAPRGACGRSAAARRRRRRRAPRARARRARHVRGSGDRVLHARALAQPLVHRAPAATAPSSVGRGGAVLGEKAKKPAQSSCGRRRGTPSSCVVVGLGLAREADDERRAERGVGLLRADAVDRGEEPVAAPPPRMRRSSGARACCSDRSKYGTTVGSSSIVETSGSCTSRRIEIEQPDAREPVRPRAGVEATQQRRERAGLAGVASVPREVLRDEHDLGGAAVDELAHLVHDRLGRPRALLAAERRDRAERARAVAALGDLDVRPRRRRRGARQLEQIAHTLGGGRARRPRRDRHRPSRRCVPSPPKPTTASTSGSASASSSPYRSARQPVTTSLAPRPAQVGEREDGVDGLLAGRPR